MTRSERYGRHPTPPRYGLRSRRGLPADSLRSHRSSLWDALTGTAIASYTASVAQGRAYAAVFILALALVAAARLTLGSGGSLALLCLGIGTLVPPTLTGHSATGDYHHSAAASLLIHVVGVTLWVGGLVAVAWYASQRGAYLGRVARSYSTLALAASSWWAPAAC